MQESLEEAQLTLEMPIAFPTFSRNKPYNSLPKLPPPYELETKKTLKKAIGANRALAELRSVGDQIPNQAILLRSMLLQEAKLSSAIENIVTTNDRLYRALSDETEQTDPQTKEVLQYESALWHGYEHIKEGKLLTSRLFIELVQIIKRIEYGVRDLPGTQIVNPKTEETIYTPPDGANNIRDFLDNLSHYIYMNDNIDPLIKLGVIHYQFEAIHPFADGNGRTGRVINILYLVQEKMLNLPILYLSQYIIQNKSDYYKGLRGITEENNWEDWILYILDAIETTSNITKKRILDIRNDMNEATKFARENMGTGYSKDLIELIYCQPYTRISFLEQAGIAKRDTASNYLKRLEEIEILESVKSGRERIYLNKRLLKILVQ